MSCVVRNLLSGGWLAAVVCLAPAMAAAQPTGLSKGEQTAWGVIDDVVRIQVTAPDGSSGEQGFGFVFGERDNTLYVATADHVVRKGGEAMGTVTVTFHHDQGHALPASLLDLQKPPKQGDLAVLELSAPAHYVPQWPPMSSIDSLVPGTRAWRIGKRGNWLPATTPGEFAEQDGIWLMFDGLDTPPGCSGGPIVTEDGIIGMVVADGGNAGFASNVLPIDTIRIATRFWQLPWDLSPAGVPSAPVAAALSRPVVEPAPPQASPPAQPPAGSALEDEVRAFATRYYGDMSDDNGTVLAFLPDLVANPITFYGQRTSLADYLRQTDKYLRRWPVRRFVLRPESVDIQCDGATETCRVTGVIDFECRNPASGRHSSGIEHILLRVRRTVTGFRILEEGLPS